MYPSKTFYIQQSNRYDIYNSDLKKFKESIDVYRNDYLTIMNMNHDIDIYFIKIERITFPEYNDAWWCILFVDRNSIICNTMRDIEGVGKITNLVLEKIPTITYAMRYCLKKFITWNEETHRDIVKYNKREIEHSEVRGCSPESILEFFTNNLKAKDDDVMITINSYLYNDKIRSLSEENDFSVIIKGEKTRNHLNVFTFNNGLRIDVNTLSKIAKIFQNQ